MAAVNCGMYGGRVGGRYEDNGSAGSSIEGGGLFSVGLDISPWLGLGGGSTAAVGSLALSIV